MYTCIIIIHKKLEAMKTLIELQDLEKEYYPPSDSYEYWDGNYFYNNSGQQLRTPSEYNEYSEGYTPFGDE